MIEYCNDLLMKHFCKRMNHPVLETDKTELDKTCHATPQSPV